MKQSFRFDFGNKIYGCSFRRGNYSKLYFGWVTVYDNEKEYQHPTHWTDYKNIPLTTDKERSRQELIDFCRRL